MGGSCPDDAVFSVEMTNNALDTAPVWQDATEASKTGGRVTFTNQTAANGWAFNFKLEVERGASGTGVLIANGKSQAVTDTKLEELTREVRAHNNFAQRVPVLEEKVKVANHRLDDLEHKLES